MDKTRIFLVDDHQMILDGIKAMFHNDSSLEIVGEATDGLQAKHAVEQEADHIDLLITDVNIPGISGIELCAYVKQHFPQIRVLIISMYQNNSVITEALMADADGYLLKTGGQKEFDQAIKRVMDGASYYSEAIYPIIWKEYQKEKQQEQLIQQLTSRELEVLQLIIKEYTSTEIADALCISKKTVDNHRQNLLTKTASKSTIGLVKYALKAGITIE
jgi:two-component system nitrate/nitrite response regulator NarL